MQTIKSRELWAVLAAAIALAALPAGANAATAYRFDPVLSLTGDCSESTVDPVPDPGLCPMPPGVAGVDHPPQPFNSPRSVATDFYGDIYVASFGLDSAQGTLGRIDVFGPDGSFITELADEFGPKSLAVDSEGNLYVFENRAGGGHTRISLFEPSAYVPATGDIAYENPPSAVTGELTGAFLKGLAVEPDNGHLFVGFQTHICEYKSAAEENAVVDCTIGAGSLQSGTGYGLAVDLKHKRIYASDYIPSPIPGKYVVRVFELEAPHALIETIDGSTLPQGKFVGEPSLAVEEESGDLFAFSEEELPHAVDRMSGDGVFISQIGADTGIRSVFGEEIGVDNGPFSPNRGYLFVPSHPSGTAHSLAFGPSEEHEPVVESLSFAGVTATEAQLRATINPGNAATSYTFELTTQQAFEAEGFANATLVGQGNLPAVSFGNHVAAVAAGLEPGAAYRFRVRAANAIGPAEEKEGAFSTYPLETLPPCANDPLRSGLSAGLPDCRAYELVTPPDTNSRTPIGSSYGGIYFPSPEASGDGNRVSFLTQGGPIAGFEGTGALLGDPYLATRGAGGWTTAAAGPTGVEAAGPRPGSASPDQRYSFWGTGGSPGSAGSQGVETTYVRYPDGKSALVGRGSAGTDGGAAGQLITEDGGHIIFTSTVRLEPGAPPGGTTAIYDRTADEVTHIVSLLPGDGTPASGAEYDGASLDGRGIAFSIGSKLYLRRDDSTTYLVGENLTFEGVAEGGGRIFYLQAGDLKAFDVVGGERITFASGGEVTPVNVAANGSAAYLVSPDVLTAAVNPNGASAKPGQQNLYLSREGAISFVGAVTDRDVEGESLNIRVDGLGLWGWAVGPSADGGPGRFGSDPSRSTPDGSVLLFQSRADLAGYDPEGHAEVYRYDAAGSLSCLSCDPTGAPASGEASLESVSVEELMPEPFNPFALVSNLRDDGRRAFFQSTERLVPADTDGRQDVYEWEAQGTGSCNRSGGCLYLISSGHSAADDYLYAVGDGGEDVFFRSADLLLGADTSETPSIYDARVDGGFPEPPATEPCEGEGCRSSFAPAPQLGAPAVAAAGAEDNLPRRCPKAKRRVMRHGRVRCVKKKHPKHGRHRRAGAGRKGGAK